jgi:hypothetical protein
VPARRAHVLLPIAHDRDERDCPAEPVEVNVKNRARLNN